MASPAAARAKGSAAEVPVTRPGPTGGPIAAGGPERFAGKTATVAPSPERPNEPEPWMPQPPPQPIPSGWMNTMDDGSHRAIQAHDAARRRSIAASAMGDRERDTPLVLRESVKSTDPQPPSGTSAIGRPQETPPTGQVQLEARSSVRMSGAGGLQANATVAPASARRKARTTIGKAVLKNRAQLDLIAASFLLLVDDRIRSLRQQRSNSEEACQEIAVYEDLKRRIEAFLAAASGVSAQHPLESTVVDTTTSFAAGIGDWWSKRHVQICDGAFGMGLFGIGVTICSLAGAGGLLAAAIPGAMIGGKPVVDVVKAFAKRS
jgi:hypothetical protein